MAGEKNLQNYFRRQAKAAGCLWYKIAAEGVRGLPDVMLIHQGRVILIELKNPNGAGTLSMSQVLRHRELIDAGVDVRVICTKKEVDDVIDEIGRDTAP